MPCPEFLLTHRVFHKLLQLRYGGTIPGQISVRLMRHKFNRFTDAKISIQAEDDPPRRLPSGAP
jgi:hypothetical protein